MNSQRASQHKNSDLQEYIAPRPLNRNGNVFPPQRGTLWISESPKLVTAELDGIVMAKSRRALMVHESGFTPVYYFPREDVSTERLARLPYLSEHSASKGTVSYFAAKSGKHANNVISWSYENPVAQAAAIRGYHAFYFNRIDQWFEDGDEIFGSPPDPFVRIDIRNVNQRLVISHQGEVVVDTMGAKVLYETGLTPRFYVPLDDVRVNVSPSSRTSVCVYKGAAHYLHLMLRDGVRENALWSYSDPRPECHAIGNRWAFEFEKFDGTHLDGEPLIAPLSSPDGTPTLTRGDLAPSTET